MLDTVGLVAEGVLALDGGDLTGPLDVVWPDPPDGTAPDLVIANLVIGPSVGTSKYFWNDQGAAFQTRSTSSRWAATSTCPWGARIAGVEPLSAPLGSGGRRLES